MPTSKTIVSLEIRIKELEKQLSIVNAKLKGVGTQGKKSVDQVSQSFTDTQKIIKKFSTYFLRIFSTAAIIGSINKSIAAMKEFEQSFTNVLTLMSEAERKKFGGFLRQGSIDLMKNYGFAVQDVNKALFDSISAGVKAGDSIKFMNEAAKLAIGGVTSLSVAVDGMTSIMNAYRLEAKDAEKVSAAFFTAQKYGKTTVEELASSIGRVAPIAKSANISYQEMLSALALLTAQGISTEEAVTGLRATIKTIADPIGEAEKAFKELGIETGLTAISQNGLGKTLLQVAQAVKKDKDKLTELIPEQRALVAVAALGEEALTEYNKVLEKVNEDYGESSSLTAAYKLQMATLANSVKRISGAMRENMLKLGAAIAPVFKRFADAITPIEGTEAALRKEQITLNNLVDSITDANVSEEARLVLIEDLQEQYPDFISNIEAEKVKNEELLTALEDVNEEYNQKIQLAALGEQVSEYERKIIDNINDQARFTRLINTAKKENIALQKQITEGEYEYYKQREADQTKLENNLIWITSWTDQRQALVDVYGDEEEMLAELKVSYEAQKNIVKELYGLEKKRVEIKKDDSGGGGAVDEKQITTITTYKQKLAELKKEYESTNVADQDRLDLLRIQIQYYDDLIKRLTNLSDKVGEDVFDEIMQQSEGIYEQWSDEIEQEYQKSVNAFKDAEVEKTDITDEEEAKREEIRRRAWDSAFGLANALSQFNQAAMNKELEQAGDNEAKKEEIRKRYAKKEQTIAIAKTIIAGAEGVIKAYELGPIAGSIFAALIAIETAASVALIKSQKFAKGGYEVLGGKRHSEGGTLIPIGEAEKGEGHAVFSRWATEKYGRLLPDLVGAINAGTFPQVDMDVQDRMKAGEKLMRFAHSVSLDDSKQLEEIKRILSREREQVSYITDSKGDKYKIVQKKGYMKKMRIR